MAGIDVLEVQVVAEDQLGLNRRSNSSTKVSPSLQASIAITAGPDDVPTPPLLGD